MRDSLKNGKNVTYKELNHVFYFKIVNTKEFGYNNSYIYTIRKCLSKLKQEFYKIFITIL